MVALKGDARRNPGPGAGGDTQVAKAVAVAQHHEGRSAKIGKGERCHAGAGMVLGQHSEKTLGAEREQLQISVPERKREDRKVDRQVAQVFDQDRSRSFYDAQLRSGYFLAKAAA